MNTNDNFNQNGNNQFDQQYGQYGSMQPDSSQFAANQYYDPNDPNQAVNSNAQQNYDYGANNSSLGYDYQNLNQVDPSSQYQYDEYGNPLPFDQSQYSQQYNNASNYNAYYQNQGVDPSLEYQYDEYGNPLPFDQNQYSQQYNNAYDQNQGVDPSLQYQYDEYGNPVSLDQNPYYNSYDQNQDDHSLNQPELKRANAAPLNDFSPSANNSFANGQDSVAKALIQEPTTIVKPLHVVNSDVQEHVVDIPVSDLEDALAPKLNDTKNRISELENSQADLHESNRRIETQLESVLKKMQGSDPQGQMIGSVNKDVQDRLDLLASIVEKFPAETTQKISELSERIETLSDPKEKLLLEQKFDELSNKISSLSLNESSSLHEQNELRSKIEALTSKIADMNQPDPTFKKQQLELEDKIDALANKISGLGKNDPNILVVKEELKDKIDKLTNSLANKISSVNHLNSQVKVQQEQLERKMAALDDRMQEILVKNDKLIEGKLNSVVDLIAKKTPPTPTLEVSKLENRLDEALMRMETIAQGNYSTKQIDEAKIAEETARRLTKFNEHSQAQQQYLNQQRLLMEVAAMNNKMNQLLPPKVHYVQQPTQLQQPLALPPASYVNPYATPYQAFPPQLPGSVMNPPVNPFVPFDYQNAMPWFEKWMLANMFKQNFNQQVPCQNHNMYNSNPGMVPQAYYADAPKQLAPVYVQPPVYRAYDEQWTDSQLPEEIQLSFQRRGINEQLGE